jgi:hypothetical protein
MAHEEQKALWLDKSFLEKLKIASALKGKTMKKYVEDCVLASMEKDLAGFELQQVASNEVDWTEE